MIIQEFKGELEGVEITKEFAYWSTEWFLDLVENYIEDFCIDPKSVEYDKKQLSECYSEEIIEVYYDDDYFCLQSYEENIDFEIKKIFSDSSYEWDSVNNTNFGLSFKNVQKISKVIDSIGRK